MRVGIIGTAGRKDDRELVSKKMYCAVYEDIITTLQHPDYRPLNNEIHLVSGGAAWMDHIAVSLWLGVHSKKVDLPIKSLTLHLPAPMRENAWGHWQFDEQESPRDARTANYYHFLFTSKMGGEHQYHTLNSIHRAIELGAKVTISEGFKPRNLRVGKDLGLLIAGTFSPDTLTERHQTFRSGFTIDGWTQASLAGLKDGGTQHTWENSNALSKMHLNLHWFI